MVSQKVKFATAAAGLALAALMVPYALIEDFSLFNALRHVKNSAKHAVLDYFSEAEYDTHGRLTHYAHKTQVSCPAQLPRTAVLLVLGQSNAANHAEHRFQSLHEGKIINFFGGKCYVASSPLLGSTGIGGEPWTDLANDLISEGTADQVVLVPASVAGEPISQWQEGARLNAMLAATLAEVKRHFRVTAVLWHHGETDFAWQTTADAYARSFHSMAATIRAHGVDAPIYVSIATKCGEAPDWSLNNRIAAAQRTLPNPGQRILPGVDSDAFDTKDRYDRCHFSRWGQDRFADAWAAILRHSADAPPVRNSGNTVESR